MVTMMEYSTDTGVEGTMRKGPWDGFSGHDDDDAGVLYLAAFIESRVSLSLKITSALLLLFREDYVCLPLGALVVCARW